MALLEMSGVSKRFGGIDALREVALWVDAGEVRGLVGENGSGKSTLMRILAGVVQPDAGVIVVDGAALPTLDATARLDAGVGVVFQEAYVCPDLTVGENLLLGRLPQSNGLVDWRATHRRSTEVLEQAKLPLRSTTRVASISQDEQHMTEVARVLARDCQILVFDETTASLTGDHVERLFDVIRRRRDAGAAVVFISHRLEEIFALCDSITVLRDGVVTGTVDAATTTENEVIRLMVGRSLSEQFVREPAPHGDIVLQLRDVQAGGLQPIDLDVRAGEVVGIGGLVGSGRSTLLEAVYGLVPRTGEVSVGGSRVPAGDPRKAIRAGLGFVPEDRRVQGLAMEMSVRANATMVLAGSRPLRRRASRRDEEAIVRQLYDRLALRAANVDAPVRTLSGGNQQKVVLGRWLAHQPPVLLLDEPTRGIDVGAKREIYDIIHGLAEQGTAIVLVSSELPELLGLCDRIVVLREGRVSGKFQRGATEEQLAVAMAGSAVSAGTD